MAIKMAERHNVDTSKYKIALKNIEADTTAKLHRDEVVARLESMINELIGKVDAKEGPPAMVKSHVGLGVGFAGPKPEDGAGLEAYLSRTVCPATPLVVKGLYGSALRCGVLKMGDRITSLDGVSLDGLTITQILDKLRGSPNTSVSVGYMSASGRRSAISLTRDTRTVLNAM
jgi:C-terminal processing protease CtpA/Prc